MITVKPKTLIGKIAYWTFFVFILWVIYELIRKIVGGSLAYEALIITLLGINLSFSFYLNRELSQTRELLRKEISLLSEKQAADNASLRELILKESMGLRSYIHRLELKMNSMK